MSFVGGDKLDKKEKILPLPNYFESKDDGQTPSNTPSNKIKGGGLSYDLKNMDFTSKLDNYQAKLDTDLDDQEFYENLNHKEYCHKTYIGKGNIGTYHENEDLHCCPNIFCNKCFSKVHKILNSKWEGKTNEGHNNKSNQALLDSLIQDDNYDYYYCNCSMKNVNDNYILPENLGLDWECDGHKVKSLLDK